jgi:uncharacterized membrane protein YphA (DoxX/SURF4 family)
MRNPLNSPLATSIGLLLLRIPVGGLFLMAGFMKFGMEGGLSGFVTGSLPMAKPFMPDALGKAYLYALPFVEMLVGAAILLGWFTRLAAFIGSLVLLSILMAVTKPFDPKTGIHANTFMFAMALSLVFTGPGRIAIDGCRKGGKAKAAAE